MEIKDWLSDTLGIDIWNKKYRVNDESLDEWFDRVSGGDDEIKQLIIDKKFLFGGRILANRGLSKDGVKVTYSNCYVLEPPEDSIEGIYSTAGKLARTFSYGGGVGIDISKLRPKGSPVNNAAKTTSGAVSFMSTFSQVSQVIGQKGRRGALMISMDCDHPDIDEFIDAKKNTDSLNECNISVRISDRFMGEAVRSVDSKESELFRKLCENNWDYAEPGILFWDKINKYNLLSEYITKGEFEYSGVNPCAEEPLPSGGSCLLGALNLSEFVDKPFSKHSAFNLPEFRKAVKIAVKGLNEVLDEGLPLHPLIEQIVAVGDWRQIGLGIMGFGDMLIKMGIVYGDNERCLGLIDVIGMELVNAGLSESCKLAKKQGAFTKCNPDYILQSEFIKNNTIRMYLLSDIEKYGLRNSQIFTIAPTGSISTMLGVSGGVEPLFDLTFTRRTQSLHDEERVYEVIAPVVSDALAYEKISVEVDIERPLPTYLKCSKNINPISRVLVQSRWQNYIDASISSTVNLPNEVSKESVELLYTEAWIKGCKGLTVYREGCSREGILVSKPQPKPVDIPDVYWDDSELCDTDISNCIATGTQLQTGCGSLWVTAYFHKDSHRLCHIFLNKGSKGGCNSYMIGLSRMISLAGKKGATLDEIIDQLESVTPCPSFCNKENTSKGTSCPVAIGKSLGELYKQFTKTKVVDEITVTGDDEVTGATCPECGSLLKFTGGCNTCDVCGYTKCE